MLAFEKILWLDLLAGRLAGSHWSRLRWRTGEGLEIHDGRVAAGENCGVCRTSLVTIG